jgi:integrase
VAKGRRTFGSVRRRPSGQWQARIRDPLTGRLVSLGTYRTKGEADRSLSLATADQSRGSWVDPGRGRIVLDAYARSWLAHRPGLRPRTRELYAGLLRNHVLPSLGTIELGRLTPAVVRRWHSDLVSGRRPGASTVAKSYRLLHAILATATADELIAKNPCLVKGASIERAAERPVITVAQVYKLAEAVEDRFRALVLMAAFTGLRRGELFGLTRARLDLLHATVSIVEQRQQLANGTLVVGPPKTDAGRRTVVLPAPLVRELEAHVARFAAPGADGLVFCGAKGGPLRDHVWHGKWVEACREVGLDGLHFHDLRHVANTLAAASGASTRELMHRMGHASPDAALRYQHATRDRDAVIAAALADLMTPPKATVTSLKKATKTQK